MSAYSRVTGILSFYDEPLGTLIACVSAMSGVIDHLVAVDGAYMLFPEGKPSSDPSQMRVITEVCRGLRIGLTTHTPAQVWAGNEVEKRNHTISLAEPVTSPDGWYLVLDADCVVTHVAPDWFEQLEKIKEDGWGAISIGVRETRPLPNGVKVPNVHNPVRLMYRALRGMRYGPSHWSIHAPDPDTGDDICFWGDRSEGPIDAYDAGHLLKIDHRFDRDEERVVRSRKYYARRDSLGIERRTLLTQRSDGTWKPVTDGNR